MWLPDLRKLTHLHPKDQRGENSQREAKIKRKENQQNRRLQ